MSANGLFITACGTEVGKTLVTAALTHQLRTKGENVRVLKPVASGFDENNVGETDTGILLTAAGLPLTAENVAACTPWRFPEPISPDMAAAHAGRTIDFDALAADCRWALGDDGTALIEGIGGALVPLDATHTVRDLIKALEIPALVVTANYLGALSHTLTAVESLTATGIPIAGVVVNDTEDPPVPIEESAACLTRFLPPVPLVTVPRLKGARPWEQAPDLTGLVG